MQIGVQEIQLTKAGQARFGTAVLVSLTGCLRPMASHKLNDC